MGIIQVCAGVVRRKLKHTILLAILITIIILASTYISDHKQTRETDNDLDNSLTDNKFALDRESLEFKDGPLKKIPDSLVQMSTCPACFGTDICTQVEEGMILIHIPNDPTPASEKGVFFGEFNGRKIVIKSLGRKEEFKRYDKFICQNVTKKDDCYVSESVTDRNSYVVQEHAFLPQNLRNAWRIALTSPTELSYSYCVSSVFIGALSQVFDQDQDGSLQLEDVAMIHTSMVINPEAAFLRFFSQFKLSMPFPKFLGACGRVVVVDYGGKTLDKYLHSHWETRADLALQVLEIIDLFINGIPKWFVMFGDFDYDNFAVSDDGQVSVIDIEDVGIIEKQGQADTTTAIDVKIYDVSTISAIFSAIDVKIYDVSTISAIFSVEERSTPSSKSNGSGFGNCSDHMINAIVTYTGGAPCNSDCFQKFSTAVMDLSSPHHDFYCTHCARVFSAAMHSLACQNLLSNLPEHRTKHSKDQDKMPQGLLHDIPPKHTRNLEDLLRECVTETEAGGRLQAVEEIKDILEEYIDG